MGAPDAGGAAAGYVSAAPGLRKKTRGATQMMPAPRAAGAIKLHRPKPKVVGQDSSICSPTNVPLNRDHCFSPTAHTPPRATRAAPLPCTYSGVRRPLSAAAHGGAAAARLWSSGARVSVCSLGASRLSAAFPPEGCSQQRAALQGLYSQQRHEPHSCGLACARVKRRAATGVRGVRISAGTAGKRRLRRGEAGEPNARAPS